MRTFLLIVCILATSIPCESVVPSLVAEPKIRIGVSLPLSGGSASEGVDLQKMLRFANKHLTDNAYDLQFEDDQCSDKHAVSIAHDFIDIRHIKYVLGFACSGAVLASAPIYEKAKVPVIALATGVPEISKAGDYIFRTIPSLSVASSKLYNDAARRFKRIAILSEETAYSQGLARSFIEKNSSGALKIVAENYLPTTTDFRTILAKIRQQQVEALFLNPQSEAGMILLYQQVIDLGWDVPIYAAYYPGFEDFRQKFKEKADTIVFADLPFISDAVNEQGKEIFEAYISEYGVPRSSEFYFVTALAAFYALHQSIQLGGDVHQNLYEQRFDSIFGEFSFDKNGDVEGNALTFVLKTLREGRVVTYNPLK